MSGDMHSTGANPDNCCYDEHCREKTFSDFPFLLFHNLPLSGGALFVKKEKKELFSHIRRMFGHASSRAVRGALAAKPQRNAAPRLYKSEKERSRADGSALQQHTHSLPLLRATRGRRRTLKASAKQNARLVRISHAVLFEWDASRRCRSANGGGQSRRDSAPMPRRRNACSRMLSDLGVCLLSEPQ